MPLKVFAKCTCDVMKLHKDCSPINHVYIWRHALDKQPIKHMFKKCQTEFHMHWCVWVEGKKVLIRSLNFENFSEQSSEK